MKKIIDYIKLKLKRLNKDYIITVQSIKLVSPYVLLIDFKADDTSYYLLINGDYKEIRKKYLQKNNVEPISFNEYMDEINLLMPSEDVVKFYIKQWKIKT